MENNIKEEKFSIKFTNTNSISPELLISQINELTHLINFMNSNEVYKNQKVKWVYRITSVDKGSVDINFIAEVLNFASDVITVVSIGGLLFKSSSSFVKTFLKKIKKDKEMIKLQKNESDLRIETTNGVERKYILTKGEDRVTFTEDEFNYYFDKKTISLTNKKFTELKKSDEVGVEIGCEFEREFVDLTTIEIKNFKPVKQIEQIIRKIELPGLNLKISLLDFDNDKYRFSINERKINHVMNVKGFEYYKYNYNKGDYITVNAVKEVIEDVNGELISEKFYINEIINPKNSNEISQDSFNF